MATLIPLPHRRRHFHRVGSWLPDNPKVLIAWVKNLVETVDSRNQRRDLPAWPEPVKELDTLIESTTELRMLASAMFDEVPDKDPYREDPVGNKQIRHYKHMLDLFSVIMTEIAPKWSQTEYGVGLIGFPFNAILDWPMATQSGYAFFLHPEVNKKLKAILNSWGKDVLQTDKSKYVITASKDGWLSEEALVHIEMDTNVEGQKPLTFDQLFKCDPIGDPIHWGYNSWDAFFVREFKDIDRLRPVAYKDDPKWVVSSCESKPFALQTNVKEYDTFWLKGQSYSVAEMLNHHPDASNFIGGTVFQAFLSATSYHRWNSPVEGDVVYANVVDGTYFSEPTISGFTNPEGPDPAAPDKAQGYITHVATRAIFFINAKDPIGLICVIYVGMADVSTCEIASRFSQQQLPHPVAKGEELGMFHHGGSTCCLLFRNGLKLAWVTAASPGTSKKNIPVRSELAYAYA
ncbi:hypothetical protein G7Z17_g1570 [Cylindrodendrum hubeiense]|uniref:L-tryptophan decarboxylase PsiD-like domain-containing protein n=1 Tax=Cylindrodendrum hubeiense TaxID=595255 RepID=A0A9P5LK09_9HYPO|nr:hypothetical protein G7Z17_g1570 [Cylindrodendrum hubeiense]